MAEDKGYDDQGNAFEGDGTGAEDAIPEMPENPDVEQDSSAPIEGSGVEESPPETATMDVITGEKRLTMTAPVREFEEFKDSFKSMMVAFGNFIEAAGMEIGKNETDARVAALVLDVEKLREELKAGEDKVQESMVTRDEFDGYRNESETKSEDYVRRSEFDRFREAIREVI